MRIALALGALVLVCLAWRLARLKPSDVSLDWLIDQERRQWGAGMDGPTWRWPVRKDVG